MERGLVEWQELLEVLDMCLSLYSQLLIQDVLVEPQVVPESELGAEPVTVGS